MGPSSPPNSTDDLNCMEQGLKKWQNRRTGIPHVWGSYTCNAFYDSPVYRSDQLSSQFDSPVYDMCGSAQVPNT